MKWDSPSTLFSLYKSYIEHNVELLVILFYQLSSFHLLNAISNDIPTTTEKCTENNNKKPVANIIDDNVTLSVFLIYQITFKV